MLSFLRLPCLSFLRFCGHMCAAAQRKLCCGSNNLFFRQFFFFIPVLAFLFRHQHQQLVLPLAYSHAPPPRFPLEAPPLGILVCACFFFCFYCCRSCCRCQLRFIYNLIIYRLLRGRRDALLLLRHVCCVNGKGGRGRMGQGMGMEMAKGTSDL